MASFGNVLDLLDERYLDLVHDVVGNVEPMPTLVPYQDYVADVLVLRMDTNDKLFTALLHDFTARVAKETRKEIWTWCVQWEVGSEEAGRLSVAAPSLKKPRLEIDEAVNKPTDQPPPRREPVIEVERRVIGADLMEEEDMLRCLIDIVQADSTKVPNYIEFLYRWIDYYEGDGTALKAALKCEIPSLWDFEYHPLILPSDVKKVEEDKGELNKDQNVENNDEKKGTSTYTSLIQDLIQCSPSKKMREKPDLAAFERQTEASDRLQYREVRYGMQPPRIELPLPPLINIPRHPVQRIKYYAACFKSRQRALIILMEADLTMRQISNYQVGQEEHPRDTPEDPNDNNTKDLKGLRFYYKDAEAAQSVNILKEKMRLQREKQNEIAISSKLAVEAQIAAATGMHDGSSGVPLIPPTPSYARAPHMAADMLSRIKAAKFEGEERINFVPAPLVGRLNSRLFEGARESNQRLPEPSPSPSEEPMALDPDHDEEMNMDEDAEGETDEEIDAEDSSEDDDAESGSEEDSEVDDDDDDTDEHPTPFSLQPANVHHPKPMTAMGVQYQMPANASHGSSHIDRPIMHQAQSAQPTLGFINGTPSSGPPMVAGQPRSASMPGLPPPPIRPPTFAVCPPTYPGGSSTGPNMQYAGQRSASMPSPNLLPAPSYQNAPTTNFPSVQATSYNSSAPTWLQMPPQVAATQHGFLRPLTMQPLPASHFPPLPGAPNLVAPVHASRPPNGASGSYGTASQRSNIGSMLPPPTPNSFVNSGPSSALLQEQTALTPRAPLTPEEEKLRDYMSKPFVLQPLQRTAPPLITVTPSTAHGFQHMTVGPLPPPSGPMLSPPRPGIQRNAPTPLSIPPSLTSPSPFTSLGPSLLATTPFTTKPTGIYIQIYIPRVIVPGNGIGPGGQRLGNDGITETDALMIGHTHPGTGKITLTKAIFMPVGVWANTLNRVQREQASMLETYSPHPDHPGLKAKATIGKGTGTIGKSVCHAAIYNKLQTAYNLMRTSSARAREQQLTKRWRASKGLMTQRDRGAVWEGYGVTLDKGIEMSKADREGAYVWSWIVDEGTHKKVSLTEEEREHEARMRELEEWERMEEEEGVDLDESYGLSGGGDEMEMET